MWGNFAEIQLNGSKRNANVRLIEIKNDTIITTVPKICGDSFFFTPFEQVRLSYFLGQHVYEYDLVFENVVAASAHETAYRFRAKRMEMKKNVRKTMRSNVFQEAIFFNFNGIEFAHVLDRSDDGLKFQTWHPVKLKEVDLSVNVDGEIEVVRGRIKWQKTVDGKYQYGLQTC